MQILNKNLVLSLNRNWQVIGTKTVKDAIVKMTTQANDAAVALDIQYDLKIDTDENGEDVLVPDFDTVISMNPVEWEDWVNLPVEDYHLWFGASCDRKIRVPTVIINRKFDRNLLIKRKLTKRAIFERDGYVCQYTGQILSKKTASVDHVLPTSRGGTNTWENMVTCHKKLNSQKGNRLNDELGLKLLSDPTEPSALRPEQMLNPNLVHDWRHFIKQKNKSNS